MYILPFNTVYMGSLEIHLTDWLIEQQYPAYEEVVRAMCPSYCHASRIQTFYTFIYMQT